MNPGSHVTLSMTTSDKGRFKSDFQISGSALTSTGLAGRPLHQAIFSDFAFWHLVGVTSQDLRLFTTQKMDRSYTRREISRKIPPGNAVPGVNGTRSGNVKKTRRARPLPPNVNARNLSIEKQRREAMNKQFLVRGLACVFRVHLRLQRLIKNVSTCRRWPAWSRLSRLHHGSTKSSLLTRRSNTYRNSATYA